MTDPRPTDLAETVSVTVNGRAIKARPGEAVIAAAERNGIYIPRFCYHPRMNAVGMCRVCVVDIDTGRGPALQPSCMIEVADGMVVDTDSPGAKKAQEGVLEYLLINHPLDCPVCDKGGECPLQDQTMSHGPGESRFVEEKRHFAKPIPISDLVDLDRERCILCDRCTRFAKEVAGDPLIHFIDRGSSTQVNTFPDHEFASYFSGNTVQICPVGALTSSAYRFKARPWDLEQLESTCTACSVGCRVAVQSSRNEVLRYQGVDVDPVNWGWLCDKGRFSFQAVGSEDRLREPLVRDGDDLGPARWGDALRAAADALRAADPDRVAVIGGARLTNESAYAWAKLAKGVIGTDHVDAQLGDGLPAEVVLGLPRATIDDVCAPGGRVLLLAPDLKEELPVLYLRLRDAVVRDGAQVVELAQTRTAMSSLAAVSCLHRPGEAAAVVRALVAGGGEGEAGGVDAETLRAAAAVLADGPVTVVLGRPNVAEGPDAVVAAAAAIHQAHPQVRFLSALRRGNVHGALDMGLAPGLLPGRVTLDAGRGWFTGHGWSRVPASRGMDTTAILGAAAAGRIDVLVLLGADPLRDVPDRDLATRAVAGARTVIYVGTFLDDSARRADIVLATAGYAEQDGTTTNIEGRVSTVAEKVTAPGTSRTDWVLAAELARLLGDDLGVKSLDDIAAEIAEVAPSHRGLTPAVLRTAAAHDGIVVPLPETAVEVPSRTQQEAIEESAEAAGEPVTTDDAASTGAPGRAEEAEHVADEHPAPHPVAREGLPPLVRYDASTAAPSAPLDAYSLRLVATRKLYDRGTGVQRSPVLAPLAQGTALRLHPHDFDRLGVAAGTTVSLTSARGAVALAVTPDAGVPKGAAAVTVNQPGAEVEQLIDGGQPVTDVRVELS